MAWIKKELIICGVSWKVILFETNLTLSSFILVDSILHFMSRRRL